MPLLKNGEVIQDQWVILDNEIPETLPETPILVSLANLPILLEHPFNHPIGVILPVDAETDSLQPYLDKIKLIALTFPTFKDGRAFSQARKIREQLKFQGEIRATGHLLPDQYQFLIRTGFSTISLPETANLAVWKNAIHDFDIAYQPALGKEKRLHALRWQI